MSPLRVGIVTNVLPHYRAPFYRRLFARPDLDVRVFCQGSIPGMNLELVHEEFGDRVVLVRAMSLARERMGWQWLPWGRLLRSFDVVFLSGNVRVLSNIAFASLARALRKPVVLWGQAHTAHAVPQAERLRLLWWRWFDHFLVYTDGEAGRLRARSFSSRFVLGMNNGLDQRRIDAEAAQWDAVRLAAWRSERGLADKCLVLSSARLEPKNEFLLWARALPAVIERQPDLLWCVIGDGQERAALEAALSGSSTSKHVRWLGRILDERELAPWFLASRWLVHPGAIGLSLLHAFGYGLPVVTHDDPAAHMPEFDAFEPGRTGLLFRRGDASALAETMREALTDESGRERMGARARDIARECYNVDVMCERFARIAHHAAGWSETPPAGTRSPATAP